MAESPLFDHAAAPPVQCPRCGRLFEAPLELEVDGQPRLIRGHVQGDPASCVAISVEAQLGQVRDARQRRATRRGR